MSLHAALLSVLTVGAAPAGLWTARLGHAAVTGGLAVLGVGLLCRLLPHLPGSVRASLWWLACLKLVVDLCWLAPLALPLLPAPAVGPAPILAPLSAVRPSSASKFVKTNLPAAPAAPTAETGPEATALPVGPLAALSIWALGVLAAAGVLVVQGVRVSRQLRGATSASLGELDCEALAQTLGLRRVPAVRESAAVGSPCVAGWISPVILLPPGLSAALSADEMRLMLAHEMAHVRRGDLRWAALPTLARTLFFFHPLAWWAASEWAAAREEACDALALNATGASPALYGHLLLRMTGGETAAPALGLSPGFRTLRRRLAGLGHSPARRGIAWLLALALPVLLPWRLTAATGSHGLLAASSVSPGYTVTDLGDGLPSGLDDAGQVAMTDDAASRGEVWAAGGTASLGALPRQRFSLANAISAGGRIVGASYNIAGRGRAFVWDGTSHRVGSLPGYPYSEAHGINDAGQAAGWAMTGDRDRWHALVARAFLSDSGHLTDLGTLGGPYSAAYAVSDAGVVVGKADTETFGQTHAFQWQNGAMTDLGTLGGANSLADRVNAQGQIAGTSEISDGPARHAFLWDAGRMTDLLPLPGDTDSAAGGLSPTSDVVGTSSNTATARTRAVLWHGSLCRDLNAWLPAHSGWVLETATGLNAAGQIVGTGTLNGKPRAFLLTPR